MSVEHQKWLALTQEDALEPDLPICDPHHHLWDRSDNRFIYKRYLLDDLLADTGSGHNVVQTVFVDCKSMYRPDGPAALCPVGETEFVEGVAIESERRHADNGGAVIAGIVSFADLTLGAAVTEVLEAHLAASPTRFRGIRHAVVWSPGSGPQAPGGPSEGLMLDATFREGFACLAPHNLSFEAWLYHPQMAELIDLARAFPETTIILNHIGGPRATGLYEGQRESVFVSWKRYIAALANCPNVVVKLGGLGMPLCGFDWHERAAPLTSAELAAGMRPYYLWCIEQFGVERCMFESNFPVDKIAYAYGVMWNAFKRVAADFSSAEKAALFHDTAANVYRLDDN